MAGTIAIAKDPSKLRVKERQMAADAVIEVNEMVMLSAGYVDTPSAVAGAFICGIAMESKDNTDGLDGAVSIKVAEGVFRLPGSTLEQEDEGSPVFAENATTIDETRDANQPVAGILEKYEGAAAGFVNIDAAQNQILEIALQGLVEPT